MTLKSDYVSSRSIRTKSGVKLNCSAIIYESFVNAAAKDADGISESHLGAAVAGTTDMPLDGLSVSGGAALIGGSPLIAPRNVVITVTHATSVVAMSGLIYGYRDGKLLTEAWSVTATGTSKTFTGLKTFDYVTQITEVIVADASTNTIIAGNGDKLGLRASCAVASLVKEMANGSVVTNGVVVRADTAATADPRGTYAPNTIPDGAVDYEIWYISNQPEATVT